MKIIDYLHRYYELSMWHLINVELSVSKSVYSDYLMHLKERLVRCLFDTRGGVYSDEWVSGCVLVEEENVCVPTTK